MKERIKKLRKEKHLTQQEFADKIGISRNNVATYEIGRNNPSEAVISLICREFHVNETWLRTGDGEMFSQPSSQAEQVMSWVQNIFTHGSDAEKGLVTAMSTFTKEDFDTLARLIRKVWEGQQAFSPAETKPPALTIDEKVEAYRAELEAEEKAKERLSASPDAEESA